MDLTVYNSNFDNLAFQNVTNVEELKDTVEFYYNDGRNQAVFYKDRIAGYVAHQ